MASYPTRKLRSLRSAALLKQDSEEYGPHEEIRAGRTSLTKRFTIVGLPLIVAAAAILVWMFKVAIDASVRQAAEEAATANQAILINAIWPEFGAFLLSNDAAQQTPDDLRPQSLALTAKISELTKNTHVLKVKFYTMDGTTVFSTDYSQIGINYADRPGFRAAITRQVSSDLSHRDTVVGLHGTLADVNVMGTYIPVIGPSKDGSIVAVSEIYLDVTGIANDPLKLWAFYFLAFAAPAMLLVMFGGLIYVVAALEGRLEQEHEMRLQTITELTEVHHLNRVKSEFLAQMSHELRTPLNAIIGFSQIIRDKILGSTAGERYSEYASDIAGAANHMLTLVNDILDLDKIEAGKMAPAVEQCDLAEVLAESLTLLEFAAERRSVNFKINNASHPAKIHSDPVKVRQIFTNILSNAVKFSPIGGTVSVGLSQVSDGKAVLFECRDNGMGMPENKVRIAMTAFGRIEPAATSDGGGMGLGLALSRSLSVDVLGGEFNLESREAYGTVVTILFRSIGDRVSFP